MKKSQILSILEKSNVFSEIIKTTPSRLKTVFASEMLKNGIDMMTLKVLLGASSVTAIEKYK
jgi:site-specific recombinase XerD